MPTKRNYNQEWLPSIFNDFFDNDWMAKANATAPAINVIESDKDYKVEVAAPGMTKEEDKENKKYLRREFSYSKFQQSLVLPDDVEKDKIGAAVNNGVLTIDLPKRQPEEKAKVNRSIEIH